MRIAQINATCMIGSTGKICKAVSEILSQKGIENRIFYSQGNGIDNIGVCYSNDTYKKIQALLSRILGNWGFNSRIASRRLIKELEYFDPDVIHIHNIHAHDCNLDILFSYLKKRNVKVFWTFHDCWAFTAYCTHFTYEKCNQWETECVKCPRIGEYSWFFDNSAKMFRRKKQLLAGVDMTIITPSIWLANQVSKSFLKDKECVLINNGIDLDIFNNRRSNFRSKHRIEEKIVLLGVASVWGFKKGLDVFNELSLRLDDRYQIVLVGVDSKTKAMLPENIITIERTQNQIELAEIYSAADLFINPTREENFPTVNIEALACGTPVITFDTGGSKEMLNHECGYVVEYNDIESLISVVKKVGRKNAFTIEQCRNRAQNYRDSDKYQEYVNLYIK